VLFNFVLWFFKYHLPSCVKHLHFHYNLHHTNLKFLAFLENEVPTLLSNRMDILLLLLFWANNFNWYSFQSSYFMYMISQCTRYTRCPKYSYIKVYTASFNFWQGIILISLYFRSRRKYCYSSTKWWGVCTRISGR
jgi:hypothetical protein